MSVNNEGADYVVGIDFGAQCGRALVARVSADYVLLHDYPGRGASEVMHRLSSVRDKAAAGLSPEGSWS